MARHSAASSGRGGNSTRIKHLNMTKTPVTTYDCKVVNHVVKEAAKAKDMPEAVTEVKLDVKAKS